MMTLIWVGVALFAALLVVIFAITMSIKVDSSHEVSEQSWHVKLYKVITAFDELSEDMPKTVCSYFWNYVIAILLLPIAFPGIIINLITSRVAQFSLGRPLYVIVSVVFFAIIALSYQIGVTIGNDSPIWLAILVGFAFLLVLMGIIVGLVLIVTISSRKEIHIFKSKPNSLIMSRFKAWKDKNCPIIKYK